MDKPAYWDEATRSLARVDPVMQRLVRAYPGIHLARRSDAFTALARAICGQQISVKAAEAVWRRFVAAVAPSEALAPFPALAPADVAAFDPAALDGCATQGVDPVKSHWARPLDTPPFYAYPLRPGITFTYLSLTVNRRAQVLMQDGSAAANIFAAGEIMSGNILGQGYMAGCGMTIGTVFGRIAGKESVRYVVERLKRS